MQRIRQRLNLWQRARVRCGAGGGGARGGAAAQPKDGARRDALIGVVAAPPSADDAWLRLEELAHCQEKVAEYDAAALRRHAPAGAMLPQRLSQIGSLAKSSEKEKPQLS